jgi:hypothetical protein
MLRRTRLLLPLAAVLALAPASGAQAAKATFSATFEAERSVAWDQPRTVSSTTCRGENYYLANGGEETSLKTKPFKVTVETLPGVGARWTFHPGVKKVPDQYGVAANGPDKRWFYERRGTTGGWCGGGDVQPNPERDCGTKLPDYVVAFHAHEGLMSWSANHAPWMANERLSFYTCNLITPAGMHNGSFPRLEAKYAQKDVFNRRKPRLDIGTSKTYGPDSMPLNNAGVKRTTTGKVTWKLVLTRTRR